ncbi:ferrochelatase [Geoalkalibacter halelectricus]|uniref:Ferrochelatase n=1 Tax=Geoalkalibacter halelectricus TaxID=2847045 RepID=A0ABY5ZUH8_9BACT|nr:ferrochelatase [Geoalkalibacter halelectricus]MDO3377364.1 ferrochelatase [Geoalkalibacter halelectricus]UWZ80871.1 ferrochelatase [Geoalkalibacter halelectricus]
MNDGNPGSPIGIVLLNMGGPDSLEAVEPFLYNLFADRDLIQLPLGALLQKPFARLISHFRAKNVVENYRAIGGKTPLLHWTQRQAQGIAAGLGTDWRPYVAMRYWQPRADETLARMKEDGVSRALVLSMYPHYTGATTGSSVKDFRRAAAAVYPELKYRIIEHWYDWPGYLDALALCVRAGLEKFPEDQRARVQILFSAHALPQKFIDRGDPYLEHVLDTTRGVMKRIGNRSWRLGFQSRSGPVKWMEPDTVDVIDQLAAEGRQAVLLVPISFVSDHIETLHEIDIEYREHAHAKGIAFFERSPSLNDAPEFIAAMADLVSKELENWR